MKLLCVPGLACSSDIFEHAARYLPEVQLAFAEWPLPERLDSLNAAARWLGAQVDAVGAQAVLGHSLGGLAALHLGVMEPGRSRLKRVIADTFLAEPHPMFRNLVWDAPPVAERVDAMLARLRPKFPRLRAAAAAFEGTADWVDAALRSGALFIYGGRGGGVSDRSLAIRAGIPPDATNRVAVVPDTAHFPMLEAPAAFYAHVRAGLGLSVTPATLRGAAAS